ncbi:hypothetical protein V1331_12050 (plasmid) [Levilactobacillus brevis]|uniref:hypothetical protein n=1 Tax=Levilactobacillus brevis TaxID=1580 RepID=UPI003DA4D0D3
MKKLFVSILFVISLFTLFIVSPNNASAKNLKFGLRTATLPTHYLGMWAHHLDGHRYVVMDVTNRHTIYYTDYYEANKSRIYGNNNFIHFIVAKDKSDKSSKRFYMYNPKIDSCTLYTKHGHVYVNEDGDNMKMYRLKK